MNDARHTTHHAMVPPSLVFRQEREATWRELEALVSRIEAGNLRSLSNRDLGRLPLLYRSTLSSLAVARTMSLSRNQLEYLEVLCARAYTCMNAPPPKLGESLKAFFVTRFPRAVRRFGMHVATATLVLLLGVATGFVMVERDPENYYVFVEEAYAQGRDPSTSTEELRAVLYDGGGTNADQLSAFSAQLMSHNARIGMMCFALGFAFGIPVVYLLFTNGLIIGAFGALYHSRGLGWDLVGWLLPHGVPEIFAVILCGAAGLAIAQALVFPRRLARMESLRQTGRHAGVVVLGAVFLFFVAALIEGFFRQIVDDIVLRYAMIGTGAAVLAAWLLLSGRPAQASAAQGARS